MTHIKAAALVALASIITSSTAHSWVEQLMAIDGQGQFTGNPGYVRNATARQAPNFSDLLMVHILPGQGQPAIEERGINSTDTDGITPTDPMCKQTQQQQIQSSSLPRLSAAPGSLVALRYEENGHVSLPQNQLGKPPNRGNVYVYGTTQPKANENFLDVFNQWTTDGTGGDKRGKLLETQPFDDGHCYQVNSGAISAQRQQQYPHTANQLMGTDLWCQNDIKIPADAVSGKPYTLYWVWDWPTEPGVDPNLPKGKAEIYTSCMDIDITAAGKRDLVQARAPEPQASSGAANANNAAIPSYMSSLTASTSAAPAATSAPAPPMSSASASPTPSAALPSTSATEANMDSALAVSVVEAAIASEVASILAADKAAITPTTSTSVSTVTATAGPQSQASQSPAISSSGATSSPLSQTPAVTSTAQPVQPSQASGPGNPPSSMNIQPPVLSGISGTATAVTAVPSASPSSSVIAGASTAPQGSSSGSAAPSGPTAPTNTAGACGNSKCRAIKRSRILGSA